jgi:cation diffusion facilitator family transporter
MESEQKREKLKKGEKAAGLGTLSIILLAIAEALIGLFSGSIILVTDALHNAADSMASFASWFGLKISQKKATERFPYGYYKAESLATFFVSIFILYAAYELLIDGYAKLFVISEVSMPIQALGIACVSAIVSYFLSRYMKKIGKDIDSQSLIANAQERMTHIFSSAIIFVAILLTFFKVPYVEGIVTIFFSLVIFKLGITSSKDSILALMDVSPSKDIENRIKETIQSIGGVEDFENLKLRKAGPFIFGEVNIKIRKRVNVEKAHEISDNIENKIKEVVEQVDSFSIHIEPYETKTQKIVVPIKEDKGLDSPVMNHFGRADYFIFATVNKDTGKVKSNYVKENPHKKELVRAGFKVADFIVKEKIDVLITKEIGGISFHVLRDNLVDIYKAKGRTVKKLIHNFVKGRLNRLEKPTKELGEISRAKVGRKK